MNKNNNLRKRKKKVLHTMNVMFNKFKNVVNSNGKLMYLNNLYNIGLLLVLIIMLIYYLILADKFRHNFIQSVKSSTISEATLSTIQPPSTFIDFLQIDQKNTFNGTTDLLRFVLSFTNDYFYKSKCFNLLFVFCFLFVCIAL